MPVAEIGHSALLRASKRAQGSLTALSRQQGGFPARSFSSTAPTKKLLATRIPNGGIISVHGPNTYKLLQGLVTNDVRRFEEQVQRLGADPSREEDAFYCGFLNPQGRLIAPSFVLPTEKASDQAPTVLLDCHKDSLNSLKSFITKFMLRSRVKMQDATSEWNTWVVWSDDANAEDKLSGRAASENNARAYRDARTPRMGWRVVSKSDAPESAWASLFSHAPTQVEASEYTRHRMIQGVPEGPVELPENSSLPLEANLDLMGGVDFRKGCYVGQELTARTHHTGVVRKRVIPVKLLSSAGEAGDQSPPIGQIRAPPSVGAASKRSKAAGGLLAATSDGRGGALGLAMLRLQHVANAQSPLELPHPDGEGKASWTVQPTWPDWWPSQIRESFEKEAQGGAAED
ncbi:unnamed protein product [Jaminaea pallidilutea]